MDSVKIEMPGKPAYLSAVRLAISSIAAAAGFDLDAAEDIKTAVTEACKNVSCHGVDGFSDKYEVDLAVEQGHMEITVRDNCDEHTHDQMCELCSRCPDDCDLGVMVIRSLMTDVDVIRSDEQGHKSITMMKEI